MKSAHDITEKIKHFPSENFWNLAPVTFTWRKHTRFTEAPFFRGGVDHVTYSTRDSFWSSLSGCEVSSYFWRVVFGIKGQPVRHLSALFIEILHIAVIHVKPLYATRKTNKPLSAVSTFKVWPKPGVKDPSLHFTYISRAWLSYNQNGTSI